MRYSNRISKWMLAAGIALAGASALPAADWRDSSYREQPAVRADYREVSRNYSAVDRLRDQIADGSRATRGRLPARTPLGGGS